MELTTVYFSSAVTLGALHALEPGHAKTLTAAYLIGTKGTKRDALLLGISVAVTHSFVVIGLSIIAVILGNKAFPEQAMWYLAVGSGALVVLLGSWLFFKRLRVLINVRKYIHSHRDETHSHGHDVDHALLSDEDHAKAHLADLPDYVHRGERPTMWQILTFGAAGGLIPCPAAVSVMLLALTLNHVTRGLFLVLGFSFGLAVMLVLVGMLVVMGVSQLNANGKLSKVTFYAPLISASLVIFSGVFGVVIHLKHLFI